MTINVRKRKKSLKIDFSASNSIKSSPNRKASVSLASFQKMWWRIKKISYQDRSFNCPPRPYEKLLRYLGPSDNTLNTKIQKENFVFMKPLITHRPHTGEYWIRFLKAQSMRETLLRKPSPKFDDILILFCSHKFVMTTRLHDWTVRKLFWFFSLEKTLSYFPLRKF